NRFNGIGGKIEDNELAVKAMQREFEEETGIKQKTWKHIVHMRGNDWVVKVFATTSDSVFNYKTMEQEHVLLLPLTDLEKFDCISNLYWLIPLCLDALNNQINYI